MNPGAANIIVEGFLKGVFDVFDALLSQSFMFDTAEIGEASADQVNASVAEAPVVLRGKVKGGGAVCLLLPMADAAKIVSLTNTGEAAEKDAFDEAELGTLKEIADSALGGGVSNLSDKFGENVELEGIEAFVAESPEAAALSDYVGDAVLAAFQFSAAPQFDSNAMLVFSTDLEQRAPQALVDAVFGAQEGAAGDDQPFVSEDEINDILSGFDADADTSRGEESPARREAPPNLDVILDIQLNAVARLGRVEMPIADVLSLGPGSIIDVGHNVDEPVELLVNDKLIARGDVVVVDEKFGLRITEIVSQRERIESLG